jgi:mRNA-degrading endonuclease toxin of MazEF toxin-antitoxin module
MISPGEIYFADLLDAGRGPVLIASREPLNRGDYAVMVAFTSSRQSIDGYSAVSPNASRIWGLSNIAITQIE